MTAPSARFSIVTPTLNQGEFIEQSIRSLKAQTFEDFEHIIVDGGSDDETLDILRRHEGTYPMRWTSEPDQGMYDAVNKGMASATGDIVAYLNSDDLYFPWTLEVIANAFDEHPNADFVFGDAIGAYEDSRRQEPRFQPSARFSSLLRGGYLVQPAVFWRRELQEEVGEFDPRFKLAGDLDWWLRAGPERNYVRVDEMVTVERDHSQAKRMAQWNRLIDESETSRARIETMGKMRRRLGVVIERLRAWIGRRVLWLRFALASRRGERSANWGYYIAAARPKIPVVDALLAQVPWVGPRLDGGSLTSAVDWLDVTAFETDDGTEPASDVV